MNLSILSTLPIFPADATAWVSLIVFGAFAALFVSKLKWERKTILILLARCVVGMALTVGSDIIIHAIMKPFGPESFPNVDEVTAFLSYFATPILVSTLACIFIHDYKWIVRIVESSLLVTSWVFLPSVSFLLIEFIPNLHPAFALFPRIAVILVMFIILRILNFNQYHFNVIWNFLVFEAFVIVEFTLLSVAHFNFQLSILNVFCLFVWIVELIVYVFFYLSAKSTSEKYAHALENQKLRNDVKLMSFMSSTYEQMRLLKHDMKNQFAFVSALYDQGKDEEAKKYFSELALSANETLNFASTGNTLMDIVLNMTLSKAKTSGIDFEYICSCPPEMPFAETELFSLLINVLDNAIEGSARNEVSPKKVDAHFYVTANYFIIDVSNPVDPDVDKKTLLANRTAKRDKIGHGYGKRIIKRVVTKYSGDMVSTIKDSIYEVKIMLALEENPSAEAKEAK